MKWLLILMILDEDGDVIETNQYRFPNYMECMDFRSFLFEMLEEDEEVHDYKLLAVNTT